MKRADFLKLLGSWLLTMGGVAAQSQKSGPSEEDSPLTIGLIGDPAVGKSSLIYRFINGGFPGEIYEPPATGAVKASVRSPSTRTFRIRFKEISPAASANPGAFYSDIQVNLICFSSISRSSYDSLTSRWLPEIERFAPHTPRVLAGLKEDLMRDPSTLRTLEQKGLSPIVDVELQEAVMRLEARKGYYCSSLTGNGTAPILEDILRFTPGI